MPPTWGVCMHTCWLACSPFMNICCVPGRGFTCGCVSCTRNNFRGNCMDLNEAVQRSSSARLWPGSWSLLFPSSLFSLLREMVSLKLPLQLKISVPYIHFESYTDHMLLYLPSSWELNFYFFTEKQYLSSLLIKQCTKPAGKIKSWPLPLRNSRRGLIAFKIQNNILCFAGFSLTFD